MLRPEYNTILNKLTIIKPTEEEKEYEKLAQDIQHRSEAIFNLLIDKDNWTYEEILKIESWRILMNLSVKETPASTED